MGVPEMSWNTNLATSAMEIANRCDFAHSTYSERKTLADNTFSGVGENYAWTSSGNPITSEQIDYLTELWANEKADYTNPDPDAIANDEYVTKPPYCKQGEMCGHYTQMVWSSSTSVGCAAVKCDATKAANAVVPLNSGTFLVCHYGIAGNWQGQVPYINADVPTRQ